MAGLCPEPSVVEKCIHAMEIHSVLLVDLIGIVLHPAAPSEIGCQFLHGFPVLLHQIMSIERVELYLIDWLAYHPCSICAAYAPDTTHLQVINNLDSMLF